MPATRLPLTGRIAIRRHLGSVLRYGSDTYRRCARGQIRDGMTVAEVLDGVLPGADNFDPSRERPTALDLGMLRRRGHIAIDDVVGVVAARSPRAASSVIALSTFAADPIPDFTFGVEIEAAVPHVVGYEGIVAALVAAGLPAHVDGRLSPSPAAWKVTSDGSLRFRGRQTFELVSPILAGAAGLEALRTAARVLTEIGARVNRTCGLHVHVGARVPSIVPTATIARPIVWFKSILRLYAAYAATIDGTLAPSRRAYRNNYCRPVTNLRDSFDAVTDVDELRRAVGADRWRTVNLEAFPKHGTIEFRQHQGTIEAEKIEGWVRFVLRIAAWAALDGAWRPHPTDPRTLTDLLALIGATASETRYLTGRAAHFARLETATAARRAA